MIRALSPGAALALVAVLALTSVTSAIARGQAPAVDQAVICTGTGVVTVALDAQGNPTGMAHPCPDCTLTLATPAVCTQNPGPVGALVPLRFAAGASVHATAHPIQPIRARAPPRSV